MKEMGLIPVVGVPCSRKWQPAPGLLPGIPMDRRAWWATVPGVAESDITEHARKPDTQNIGQKLKKPTDGTEEDPDFH